MSNHFNHNKFHSKINNYIFSLLFQIKMNFVTTKNNIHFTAISDRIKNDFKYIYNKNKNINRIYNLTDQKIFMLKI